MRLVVVAALALAPIAANAQQTGNGVAGAMPVAPVTPLDRLSADLAQIGMAACAGPALRAARFLFESGQANYVVQPMGPDANRWPTVITIESAHADMGRTRFATLTVSPTPDGCAGFYEQVVTWPQTCAALQTTVFVSFKAPRQLLGQVTVLELNPAVQVHLVPGANGQGCTSVKRELFR